LNISSFRQNINKLIKHKTGTMNLSFKISKNKLSSIKTQGKKGQKFKAPPPEQK